MCSSPAINPKLPSSAPSKGHTATLVGLSHLVWNVILMKLYFTWLNLIIFFFKFLYYLGSFYNGGKFVQSNQIYMIDVSDKNNFKWVKDFTPNSISETANNGIASVIIIVSVSCLLYRRTRNACYICSPS